MNKRILLIINVLLYCAVASSQPPRLQNCGVTCYINASTQALLSITPLTNLLRSSQLGFYKETNAFGNAFQELVKNITSRAAQFDPIRINYTQQSVLLMGANTPEGIQGDASEFIERAFNALLTPSVSPTIDISITIGGSRSCFIQEEDKWVELDQLPLQSERILKVPIDEVKNNYLVRELVNYIEPVGTGEYEGRQCSKSNSFIHVGSYFCIALNRFGYDEDTQRSTKISSPVAIPLELNMGPLVIRSVERPNRYEYALQAAVIHMGNDPSSGHYYAYVKYGSDWYYCNDRIVEKVPHRGTHKYIREIDKVLSMEEMQKDIDVGYVFIYRELTVEEQLRNNLALLAQRLNELLTLLHSL